ncbi:capsular biosynthesis protein CpsH [Clostridium vincentii]|uniref:Lipopolysaccharide biosynthesis protein n=1 Tax=Clostridium vincentii TaxID=52704 RepID=A0A2T0BJL5_9CLOT|nr:capsular biosynthesis protein CpsH [Clostridium vincentii]PRR84080.1 hypothetical protein CLVI_03780 [Clostridium vincentii]
MNKVDTIKGKRILFMTPPFFGYEKIIPNKMRELGAIVDYYDARSITKAFDRALLKVSPNIFSGKTNKYFENMLNEFKGKDYNYILIQNCEMITGEILTKFRKAFPNAKLILYLCDTVKNIKGITKKNNYFDNILSFDLGDTKKYNDMIFRPLFYADCYRQDIKSDNKYKYDLCFIGTIHSDRYKVIKNVKKICDQYKMKCFMHCYLQSDFIYIYYKLTKKEFFNAKKSEFTHEKLSSTDIARIVNDSRVVLDIQHPKQAGLTMRTIEMLGMNKKLITTNKSIKDHEFYNENNILVIDRKNVRIDKSFFNSPYQKNDDDIYNKYSIESWLREILL